MLKLVCLLAVLHSFAAAIDGGSCQESPYVIMIDGGSTGSRMHIFEFIDDRVETIGGGRVDKPLSAMEPDPDVLREHLMPLFEVAKTHIPRSMHESTEVFYAATAGMRLLTEAQQETMYEAMYAGLSEHGDFTFRISRDSFFTLSGSDEGFYGAVAAQYLDEGNRVLGVMDMGGASTQIVIPYDDEDYFSVSHLSYGVDKLRERQVQSLADSNDPCSNRGTQFSTSNRTWTGTGDVTACKALIDSLISSPTEVTDRKHRLVAGVHHPTTTGWKFWAMCLYFFSLDSIRHYTRHLSPSLHEQWPTPTLNELTAATTSFCSLPFTELGRLHADDQHEFTRDQILSNRCFEALYMISLLESFGFEQHTRDITFLFEVNGSEVEWTLGMAIQYQRDQAYCGNEDLAIPDDDNVTVAKNVTVYHPVFPHSAAVR